MHITYLADHLHHVPQLATWHHAQWGHIGTGNSVARRAVRLHGEANYQKVPTTVIAQEGDVLLGSASLIANDLHSHPHLTPWLASVYVTADRRRAGIGSALVQRIMAEARELGYEKLYLVTEDAQSFYAKLGWFIQEEVRQSADVTLALMVYQFCTQNSTRTSCSIL